MDYGTKIHEILEYTDFKAFKTTGDNKYDKIINNLLSSKIMKNIDSAKIFKELEFIYDKDDVEYHGIIDLMLEYDDYINIIDYKLNDLSSKEYIDQLTGYKNFISSKTDKKINIYLYSILSGEIKKL